jgi:hypothetical protein
MREAARRKLSDRPLPIPSRVVSLPVPCSAGSDESATPVCVCRALRLSLSGEPAYEVALRFRFRLARRLSLPGLLREPRQLR